jgi:cysteinyl-tRNA synthetase
MTKELYIYNSLTRSKDLFQPIQAPHVGLYVCGPTVYSNVHLGNCRTFMFFDVVFRYLTHLGYKVRYVRNITDVGHITSQFDEGVDRIGEQARLEQLEPMEIVQKYTDDFRSVMRVFNNHSPSIEPTATGHMIEQIEMIKKIVDQGFAYEVNGSIYFDVQAYRTKYPYGELSGRNVEELYENTRTLDGQDEKRFFADFALWKKASPEHIMRWPSPWGEGFPGWHLECSAMSTKYLGEQFDIHGGGMDLKFPHHESEIAQNTACCGKGPVRYWMHSNMLTVNGQKMSKSLGNSFLPHELFAGSHPLLEKGYAPQVVRFFMMQAHYRSTLDFSNEALNAAERGYERMMSAYSALADCKPSASSNADTAALEQRCYAAMGDDFNTPVLVAELFEAVRMINGCKNGQLELTAENLVQLKNLLQVFLIEVLGVEPIEQSAASDLPDVMMDAVFEVRRTLKEKKDYATADLLREVFAKRNIGIKDTKEGGEWSYEKK